MTFEKAGSRRGEARSEKIFGAVLAAIILIGAAGCTGEKQAIEVGPEALYPIQEWQAARQRDYLDFACAQPISPTSIGNLIANLECETLVDGFGVPAGAVADDALDSMFKKIYSLRDTSDFDMLRIINLLYSFDGHPVMSEQLWSRLRQAVLDFKFWYIDPTPEREIDGKQVVDVMWYWSENHILIFHTVEYLAGLRYADEVFTVSGMTGAEHARRARAQILEWLEERARWGFTEWHSDVYYNWDMMPLLTLVEWSPDAEIIGKAAIILDIALLDYALHIHRGNMGVTHGRSYIKDKPTAALQDVFPIGKLFFDDTELPYLSPNSTNAALFARAKKYALPEVIRNIATYDEPMVDRERMNLPIAEEPPANLDDPHPPAPYGLSYTDEKYLPLWWSMSAMIAWPMLPMTFDVAARYNLYDAQFADYAIFLETIVADTPEQTYINAYPLYQQFWPLITAALLEEVNTYTYRTADYMLSGAQDYRKGLRANQQHAWQATLSEHAVAFTTHPAFLPAPDGIDDPTNFDWNKDQPGPGYWTGEGSWPRIGQHENVLVAIYAPQYTPLSIKLFDYREETHAYFPTVHYDEYRQVGNWIFGRKDDGYIALWSYRKTAWRSGQPEVYQNAGQPFDLVAAGAPNNVWITEMGSKSESGDFDSFVAAISAAEVTATINPDAGGDGYPDGYNVSYNSPAQGAISFGWTEPLVAAGAEIDLGNFDRLDNPFVNVVFDSRVYDIGLGYHGLHLDFDKTTRKID